jgi:hypothetical protein
VLTVPVRSRLVTRARRSVFNILEFVPEALNALVQVLSSAANKTV